MTIVNVEGSSVFDIDDLESSDAGQQSNINDSNSDWSLNDNKEKKTKQEQQYIQITPTAANTNATQKAEIITTLPTIITTITNKEGTKAHQTQQTIVKVTNNDLERFLIRQNEHSRHKYSASASRDLFNAQSRAAFSNVSSGHGDDSITGAGGSSNEKTDSSTIYNTEKLQLDIDIVNFIMFYCYNSIVAPRIVWPKYGLRNPSGVMQYFLYFSNDDYNHSKWDHFIQRQPLKHSRGGDSDRNGGRRGCGHEIQQSDYNYPQRRSNKRNTFELRSNENTMKRILRRISYRNLIRMRLFAFGNSIEKDHIIIAVSLQVDTIHYKQYHLGCKKQDKKTLVRLDTEKFGATKLGIEIKMLARVIKSICVTDIIVTVWLNKRTNERTLQDFTYRSISTKQNRAQRIIQIQLTIQIIKATATTIKVVCDED